MFKQRKEKEDPEQKFYKKLGSIDIGSFASSLLHEADEHESQLTKFVDDSKDTNGSTRLIKPVEEKEVKTPLQQPSKPQSKKKQKEEKTASNVSPMTDELQEKILVDAVARNRSAELINDERERRNKRKQQVQQQAQNQQQEVDDDGWKFEESPERENRLSPKQERELRQSRERAAKRKKQGKKPTKIKFDTSNVDYDHPTVKHPENGSQSDLEGPEL